MGIQVCTPPFSLHPFASPTNLKDAVFLYWKPSGNCQHPVFLGPIQGQGWNTEQLELSPNTRWTFVQGAVPLEKCLAAMSLKPTGPLPQDAAILLLGINRRETKAYVQQEACTRLECS